MALSFSGINYQTIHVPGGNIHVSQVSLLFVSMFHKPIIIWLRKERDHPKGGLGGAIQRSVLCAGGIRLDCGRGRLCNTYKRWRGHLGATEYRHNGRIAGSPFHQQDEGMGCRHQWHYNIHPRRRTSLGEAKKQHNRRAGRRLFPQEWNRRLGCGRKQ